MHIMIIKIYNHTNTRACLKLVCLIDQKKIEDKSGKSQ